MPRKEKYPDKCPWDAGPDQARANDPFWIMTNGEDMVTFTRSKMDVNYFYIEKNSEDKKSFLSFQARLTYQKLLDQGYWLEGSREQKYSQRIHIQGRTESLTNKRIEPSSN